MRKQLLLGGFCLLLAGCASSTESVSAVDSSDLSADLTNASTITFDGDSVKIDGNGLSSGDSKVTISQAGTYLITGTTSTYTIDVDVTSKGDVKLVLENASITSDSGPTITVSEASKTYIFTEEATSSDLTTSGSDENGETAVIMSHDDLVLSGDGVLTIAGEEDGIKANDTCVIDTANLSIEAGDDGINVNDELTISNSTVNVLSNGGYENGTKSNMTGFEGERPDGNPMDGGSFMDEAYEEESDDDAVQAKGIKCDGAITISQSTLNINASDDALHSNDTITIESGALNLSSGDDGVHADNQLTINDGTITISNAYEGLESQNIDINGGIIDITSSDDGINSANGDWTGGDMQADDSMLVINDGTITISAEGDGIDMNGDGEMNGGYVTIYGPTNGGNGALDYAGTFNVNGGTLLAGGASGMQQSPSDSSQSCSIMIDASGKIELKDSEENTIATYESEKSYGNLVIASDQLVSGETYMVYQDGEEKESITISSTITNASTGTSNAMGGENMNDKSGKPDDNGMMQQSDMNGGTAPSNGGETPPEKPEGDFDPKSNDNGSEAQSSAESNASDSETKGI